MSDDFQRDALAPLMCPRHDCESTRHALNQLRVENKHLRAEIERLRQQRDQLLAALKAIVRNSMFEQRFDHCGFMNATALSDRDLFRKLWANARDAIEKAEGRSDE